jgi:hypothetical protein
VVTQPTEHHSEGNGGRNVIAVLVVEIERVERGMAAFSAAKFL